MGGYVMYDFKQMYLPYSIEEALELLEENKGAEIISGGTDVLIKMREGKLEDATLINIHEIKELKGIHMEEDGTIVIGAGTVFSHITNNEIIQTYIPMLGEAVDEVGGPQIRNMGTIGGNICNGVTSADSASSLFVFNAVMELRSKRGTRYVPMDQWYVGAGQTVREQDELLVSIRIAKKEYEKFYGHYIKYGKRNAMEIATLGCAVAVKLSEDKETIEELRVAFGVAGPTPLRCPNLEELAAGMGLNERVVTIIGKGVLAEVNPRSSWRASKEFRLQLIEEMSKRAFRKAVTLAGGEIHA